MNLPNFLTLLRTLMSLGTAVLLCFDAPRFLPSFTLAFFIVAGLTDWFDGYIARSQNIVTVLGKFMDALSDKIMVIGLLIVLLALGMFQGWTIFAMFCALLCVVREFFVSGVRMLAAAGGTVLAAETVGKYKAALQMYSIGAIICARAVALDFPDLALLWDLSFYSGIATLAAATILSTWSGLGYALKYPHLFKG